MRNQFANCKVKELYIMPVSTLDKGSKPYYCRKNWVKFSEEFG